MHNLDVVLLLLLPLLLLLLSSQVLFKYCPTELLDNNYRRQLVLEELLRYQVGGMPPGGG
jgi:hypothetical protein